MEKDQNPPPTAGDSGQPLMGLEIEYHWITIAWQLQEQSQTYYWPNLPSSKNNSNPNALPSKTVPVSKSGIFVPELGKAYGREDDVAWTGLWGFRAQEDAVSSLAFSEKVNQFAACILELNTAAQPIRNYGYWMWARKCATTFLEVLTSFGRNPAKNIPIQQVTNEWKSLQDLIATYNKSIDAISLPKPETYVPLFKIKLSAQMQALASGAGGTWLDADGKTIPGDAIKGRKWIPVFSCGGPSRTYTCDVQLNYSLKLGWLNKHVEQWAGAWGAQWIHCPNIRGYPETDDYVGDLWDIGEKWPDNRKNNFGSHNHNVDIYRLQTYKAVWRAAAKKVDELFIGLQLEKRMAGLTGGIADLVRGLVIYLLAAGSVTITAGGQSTSKNYTPQLPKSSPTQIAAFIRSLSETADEILRTLGSDRGTKAAHQLMVTTLRNPDQLCISGDLPLAQPINSDQLPPYRQYAQTYIFPNAETDQGPPNFDKMWKATLNPPKGSADFVASPHNNSGFTTASPFFVDWASDVRTPIAPVPIHTAATGTYDTLIGFESRYADCVINIGFNPKVFPDLFPYSYLSLLALVETPKFVAETRQELVKYFGGGAIVSPLKFTRAHSRYGIH